MSSLDQVFLKVFQAEEPVVTDTGKSQVLPQTDMDNHEECSQGQEPQTINFPETPIPTPQVIVFERHGRKSNDESSNAPDTEKERGKFTGDFCPSRRFRKLYVLHADEQANTSEAPSVDKTGEEQPEQVSRRNIQEQALRLLVENGENEENEDETETDHANPGPVAKIFDSEPQRIIPIKREDCPNQSVKETAVDPSGNESEENQAQAECSGDNASNREPVTDADAGNESITAIPPSDGKMPRVCRQMFRRACQELGSIGNVLEKTIRAGHKIVGFKGTGRKCGASTLLLGTATELARRGWNVLVVDGSFDHPSLASSLELKTETGWDDAVFRKAPLESAMIRIAIPLENQSENVTDHKASFCFLPLIPQSVSRAIVASCKKDWLNKILDLSDHFDLVLVDTGSYGLESLEEKVQEMLRFGVDGFFLVKDTRNRVNAFIPELVDQIRKVDLACLGIIENFI
ncbi:MAG: hypothetical protein PHQ75_01690 [Thermoguttaceae bacterium]|nr:hypothetical protein [Thermoguttaceae bacterium]